MEKVHNTFIGFLFSLRNITPTLIVNVVVLGFYHALFRDGIDSFYTGRGVTILITIFLTAVWVAFWFLSYGTFKRKKKENSSIGK